MVHYYFDLLHQIIIP